MTRRRCFALAVFACFRLVWVEAEGSRSLVPVKTRTVEFEASDHVVGILEGRRGLQVVHVPREDSEWIGHDTTSNKKPISHIKSTVLTTALGCLLARNLLVSPDRRSWGGLAFVAILYLLEAFFCSTRRYLSNVLEPNEVMNYVENLKKTAPKVRWNVECYHYRSNLSSRRRHHETSDKVVTHRATQLFWFQQWRDSSRTQTLHDFLEFDPNKKETYVKVTIHKLILFSHNIHYQNYLAQQAAFIVREGNRDFYTDTSTTIEVDGFLPKLLAVRTVLGSVAPIQMSFFWFFTLLGLTVPYRIWFSRHCDEMDIVLRKEVTT